MQNKVLILYPYLYDPQSVILNEECIKSGIDVLYLPFSINDGDNQCGDFCISNGKIIYQGYDLSDVKVVFLRALSLSIPADIPAYLSRGEYSLWRAKFISENNRFSTLFSLLNILRKKGVLIINHPEAYYLHNTKSQFYSYLSNQGFSVPEFLSTNDYDAALKFCNRFNCVGKSAYGVGATRKVNTEVFTQECGLNRSPVFFQREIKGSTIRVHTVGERIVLSLKIISEGLDSRSSPTGFEVVDLPEEITKEVIKANKYYNIHYSAWDVILDKKGNYFLLDCNPGPYIYWLGSYFTRYVMSTLAGFIKNYFSCNCIKAVSEELILPKLQFAKLYINKSSCKIDFSTEYKEKLRLRF